VVLGHGRAVGKLTALFFVLVTATTLSAQVAKTTRFF
jgi:hypothetical protein